MRLFSSSLEAYTSLFSALNCSRRSSLEVPAIPARRFQFAFRFSSIHSAIDGAAPTKTREDGKARTRIGGPDTRNAITTADTRDPHFRAVIKFASEEHVTEKY